MSDIKNCDNDIPVAVEKEKIICEHAFYIADVIDETTAVVNAGANFKIKRGMYCIVYGVGEEIFDPNTNESLGILELLRGRAIVTQVQDRMCVIKSCKHRIKSAYTAIYAVMAEAFEDDNIKFAPFQDRVVRGDIVRFV